MSRTNRLSGKASETGAPPISRALACSASPDSRRAASTMDGSHRRGHTGGVELAHPELVEQDALLEAVLVVADALGDEVDIGSRNEWDGWGLVGGGPVGLGPE